MLSISSLEDLQGVTVEDVCCANVVVVNGSFFLAAGYRRAFDKAFGIRKATAGYEAIRYAMMRLATEGGQLAPGKDLFLEQFVWERVVFDEFHKMVVESEAGLVAWRAFHELQARCRWGLTGTPDLTSALAISEMAGLLHIFVPPDSPQEAQRFLDVWVRADAWDIQQIKVLPHLVQVRPTAQERTLYHGTFRLLEAQGLHGTAKANTTLLQLSSHFSADDLERVGSCEAAIARALAEHEATLRTHRSQAAALEAAALGVFETSRERNRAEDAARVAQQRARSVEGAVAYFKSTIALLERVQRGETRALECPICLGDFDCADELSVTRCGHIFCSECLEATVRGNAHCPTCRVALDPTDGHDRVSGIHFRRVGEDSGVPACRYGTKVGEIARRLRSIRVDEPVARVLIFVQWRQLIDKISDALANCGIQFLTLRGSVAEQQRTIDEFTARPAGRATLLLAIEDDDSGLNLTCANHVFFVHPMDVPSRHIAISCERQALGRVRRRGQTRDVHVYRFVTEGTLEESLARNYHSEMFQEPSVPGGA